MSRKKSIKTLRAEANRVSHNRKLIEGKVTHITSPEKLQKETPPDKIYTSNIKIRSSGTYGFNIYKIIDTSLSYTEKTIKLDYIDHCI